MKKRILAIFLLGLVLININACNHVTNDDIPNETTNESDVANDLSTNNIQNNSNESQKTDQVQTSVYTTQILVDKLCLSNAFSSALENKTKIYGALNDYPTYLSDFMIDSMAYAYVSALDLDENGINEVVVLERGDRVIILKEYKGTVYAWRYRHTALYNLRTDATYDWSEQAGNIYGSDKLQFNGCEMNPVELERVEYNEKFYISGVEVSQEEFLSYVQNQKLAEKADRYLWKTGFETLDYLENGK